MDKALETMINNMPEKTGKSLDEWKVLLKKKSFTKHSEAMKFLKEEHKVTHGFANMIVLLSKDDNSTEEDLITNQYKGKEDLLPIYKALVKMIQKYGSDVKVVPKKSSVSLVRKKQFALIKPATKTRIDLGIKFKDKETGDRLLNSGPFGSMCTHRVQLLNLKEVDKELNAWLKEAYLQAG